MATIEEVVKWEAAIYQIETSDPVIGGADGVANRAIRQLSNRTQYLKSVQDTYKEKVDNHFIATNPHPQYATLADPVFTGTPKTPTPASSAVGQEIANAAFVRSLIESIVGTAPDALDTLSELAEALGQDPNFASTMTTALAGKLSKAQNGADIPDVAQFLANLGIPDMLALKANLANPEFTGKPKAPTPSVSDNSTQIANTAFVWLLLRNYAIINSPTFTGEPKSPTPALTTNSDVMATTAFVHRAIDELIGAAPGALDTLSELATALGNDPNFATTITNALSGKQAKDDTLTALSGKDVSGLLGYLGFKVTGLGTESIYIEGPLGIHLQIFWRDVANDATTGAAKSTDMTYPKAFPNGAWGVFSTKMTYVQVVCSCESATKTGFRCYTMNLGTTITSSRIAFLAVGW